MPPRGSVVPGITGDPSVTVEAVFSPESRNIVERIPAMRQQLIRNIGEVAVLVARDMQESAEANYDWSPQPATIHNPERGYANAHAHEQIEGEAIVDPLADVITIALSHSIKTVQTRTGARGGDTDPSYYGVYLEDRGHLLQETMLQYADVLLALAQGHALEGISFVGAGKKTKPHIIRR